MVDVLMVCVGSRGDTQPFVELALALKAAGISSVVAAHPEFEGFVQNAGCCFAPVRSSLPEALHTTEAGKQMRENTGSSSLRFAPAFFMQLFQVRDCCCHRCCCCTAAVTLCSQSQQPLGTSLLLLAAGLV
jgi:hypothetical protein